MPDLLIIDDEPAIQHAFRRAFRNTDYSLSFAGTAREALAKIDGVRPDVIVLDVHLPDSTGLDTFHAIQKIDARIPIVLITGHGTTDLAIEAIKEGAFEYLLKPLELSELRELIHLATRSSLIMRTPASMPEIESVPEKSDQLVGRCTAMQDVYKAIGRIARQDVTVLITGESGTGKELVARAIYQHSKRSGKPFLAINCAAIPEALLESELFGHERGAFTGADRKRIGKFEQASGGTIFLDEVGEMSPLTQAKILRLLQEQCFERVGGEETIHTDARIIAATNANLEKMVEEGKFRKDLIFRLKVFTIHLPPLRERDRDLLLLIEHYLRKFEQELGKKVKEMTPEAMTVLQTYLWPGNVRELQSVLKQAILQMRGNVLLAEDVLSLVSMNTAGIDSTTTQPIPGQKSDWITFVDDQISAGSENVYAQSLERMEREILVRVLQRTEGNQLQAARILGITRGSLRTKIRALGINIGRSIWSEDDQCGT